LRAPPVPRLLELAASKAADSTTFDHAGDTLSEMRSSFVLADYERKGGVAKRMSPLATVSDCGALLQAAGFSLPTVDTDKVVVHYPDAWTLFHHLRAMGDSHAVLDRSASSQETLLAASAAYREMYGDAETGEIPATFQMIFLTGWAPHESMQKPMSPGSATVSLKDLSLPGVPGVLLPGEPPDEPPDEAPPQPFLTPSRRPGGPREE